ncbi:hypothetical protein HMPREF0577_1238 [Mobiluncus mulieris ATCC 35243]|nr:hypothetical protein HMPREF0577_1238 [Mobiluncus mulieris ATCC 35243]
MTNNPKIGASHPEKSRFNVEGDRIVTERGSNSRLAPHEI